MIINEKIKELRLLKNLTLEEVAKAIGTTKQNIYKYENNIVTTIPYEKVVALSKVFGVTPSELMGWEVPSYNPDTGVLTIPFVNQKLSAGVGVDYFTESDIEVKQINILSSMARGLDKKSLIAAEVKGDSMIGDQIYSGDIVIFSKGLIKQEGIYVIAFGGEVLVKRLSFNPITNTVDIISSNIKYPARTVDSEQVTILGKVIGWIHSEQI